MKSYLIELIISASETVVLFSACNQSERESERVEIVERMQGRKNHGWIGVGEIVTDPMSFTV